MKRTHTCTAYIAKSKTGSNRENRSYNQIKMCMCVEFSGRNSHSFLHDSIFYFEIWAIFLFLFSFSHASGHGYFFFFFRIAHIPFAICRIMLKRWSILVWMASMFLRNFQSRSQHENIWSVRDLDLKSMKWISQGSQTIWQSLIQNKQHMCEIFKDMSIYGFGRNFISLRS